ncbi:MAG: hypothetical protein LBU47_01465 [Christensenellaceae bacterium]|nr:hypothetical protein [Christensenellaceae bacterium]
MDFWSEALQSFVGWAVPAALTALISLSVSLWRKAKSIKSGTQMLELAVQAMLSDRLTELTERYIMQGACPACGRANIDRLHQTYKALGGNGHIDDAVQAVFDLPRSAA